jgi:5-methylcytosine-specific restriction endonuclease McrA
MGQKALTACREQGCAKLVRGASLCEDHRRARVRASESKSEARRIRSTMAWQKTRAEKRRLNPCCEDCAQKGITTVAVEIHHVESLATRPEKALHVENLRSLCRDCHRAYVTSQAGERRSQSRVERR